MKTIVLQSFRTVDVPRWLERCMRSVQAWAVSQGWDYRCRDDSFLMLAPAWVRERCAGNIYALTDVCRLQWLRDTLAAGYQRVIWTDADMLVFDAAKLDVSRCHGHAFAHEVFLQANADGSNTAIDGINNTFMLFERDDPLLDIYFDAALAKLRSLPAGPVPRTALGPGLLALLAKNNSLRTIDSIGLFSDRMLFQLVRGRGALIDEYNRHARAALGAANLCHFQRNSVPLDQRSRFDASYAQAVSRLLGRSAISQRQSARRGV